MAPLNDTASTSRGPVPITAGLNYTRAQAEELNRPHKRTAEVRPLLRRFHDDLVATLAPRIALLRDEGLVVDYATSWLLGEFVAHVDGGRVAEAQERLRECPELKNVAPAPQHPGRRRRR